MKVHIWDLPSDRVWIRLENNFQRELIERAHKITGTLRNLAKITGITINQLYNQEVRDSPKSVKFFINIFEFLNKNSYCYNFQEIENKIVNIQASWHGVPIISPKLPFDFDSKFGATVLSGIYFDGGIRGTDISNYGRPLYNNQEEVMRENFKHACNRVFGDIKFCEDKSGSVNLPKIIGYILIYCFDYVGGRKSVNNPKISKRILKNNNEKFVCQFLRQAFSDEGTVSTSEVKLRLVVDVTNLSRSLRDKIKENSSEYRQFAPNLLKGLKLLLEKVNIFVNGSRFDKEYTYVDKKGKKHIVFSWEINLAGKENLEMFYKKVGFVQHAKNEKLEQIISNIRENHLPTNRALGIVYQKTLKLQSERKIICAAELAREINRSQTTARRWLVKMMKSGYLRRVSGSGCRLSPCTYKIK